MSETGQALQARALAQLDSIWDTAKLDEWRIEYIGRKGAVNALFEQIGSIPKEERGAFGKNANEVKQALENAFNTKAGAVKQRELSEALEAKPLDVTLPGRRPQRAACILQRRRCAKCIKFSARWGFRSIAHGRWKPT